MDKKTVLALIGIGWDAAEKYPPLEMYDEDTKCQPMEECEVDACEKYYSERAKKELGIDLMAEGTEREQDLIERGIYLFDQYR